MDLRRSTLKRERPILAHSFKDVSSCSLRSVALRFRHGSVSMAENEVE